MIASRTIQSSVKRRRAPSSLRAQFQQDAFRRLSFDNRVETLLKPGPTKSFRNLSADTVAIREDEQDLYHGVERDDTEEAVHDIT